MAEPKQETILRAEDLDERVSELARVADQQAEKLRESAEAGKGPPDPHPFPDVGDVLLEDLRERLSQRVVVAKPASGHDGIDPVERQHEITKKALAHLRAADLRQIALDIGLDPYQNKDALIESIASAYGDDQQAIARIVLDREDAEPETGIAERLFPLVGDQAGLSAVAKRLRPLVGRYIRIGVAKWFVFDDVNTSTSRLLLSGEQRSYRVRAVHEADDIRLNALPHVAPAQLALYSGRPFAHVTATGVTESRAIVEALEMSSPLELEPALQLRLGSFTGDLMAWDPRSIFVLDFFDRVLSSPPVSVWDLTTARFQMDVGGRKDATDSSRATIRAVTLEGQHLLSSRTACELLVAGRGLVSVNLIVRFQPTPNESMLLPVRLELARDHASIVTGFATAGPAVAAQLHRWLVDRLGTSLETPIRDRARLRKLAAQIRARAERDDPGDTDIFSPGEPI